MANETSRGGSIPNRRVVVNALVLAFSNSRLNKVVGTDAFRSVLDAEYRTLTADGVFNLTPVWELLESQPGFDPEQAGPPMCRFKSWETLIGIPVSLPKQLEHLSSADQSKLAEACTVPSRDLQRLLRPERDDDDAALSGVREQRPAASTGRSRAMASPSDRDRPDRGDRDRPPNIADSGRRRHLWLGGAMLAALVALGVGGITAYRTCSGPQIIAFSARDITAAGVPVSDAVRIGSQVAATLADEAWRRIGDDIRKNQLSEALRGLDRFGIRSLVVRDRGGEIVAAAQYLGDTKQIAVTLR
jgi:hypothetical protein